MIPRQAAAARASRTRLSRGFTLVELMTSLLAGLIVTMSVVALARSATTSFFEQARLTTVEGSVRAGAERLRQDLARAGFMSTGNIKLARNDSVSVPVGQKISHLPGAVAGAVHRYTPLANLQAIRLFRGGSLVTSADCPGCGAQGGLLLSDVNGLTPDMLELTGNYTTDDAYRGKIVGNTITLLVPTAANNYAGDEAVARLIGPNVALANASARNAFTPGAPTGAVPANGFIARVVDPRGCHHYVIVSNVVGSATGVVITLANPDLGGAPVLTPLQDASTCGANDQEEVSISPVQRVRWFIGPTQASVAPDLGLAGVEAVDAKFDLYREVLDATGASVLPGGGPQVVAEYAVDLKFGVTIDHPTIAAPGNQLTYDMDADGANVALYTRAASATTTGTEGPQRVRSVRFRLATRVALPDRDNNIPNLALGQPQYLSRYCTRAALAGCNRFARVRYMMSEVALLNQLGMSY